MTTFFIDCPAKNTMTAIELVADSMQHVSFEPAEFARELKVVRRELADDEVDRQRVLWKLLDQTVYTTHPARHPVIGYLEVLNAHDEPDDHRLLPRALRAQQPGVRGGGRRGDAARCSTQVAKQYAGTPRGRETYVPFADEPEQLSPREAVREMEGATYDLVLAWPTVKLSHPDLYALDVAAYILGEGESSRLVAAAEVRPAAGALGRRDERHAALRPGCSPSWPPAGPRRGSRPATRSSARSIACATNWSARPNWPRPRSRRRPSWSSTGRRCKQAAEGLGRSFLTTADPLFDQAYVEDIQKVTAEQIRDVARRYFVPQRLNRVIIAPPGGAPKVGRQGGDGRPRAKSAWCGCPTACACW